METEELVRIAYLEPDYVPEAKALAVRELDKRGVPENRDRLIRQVRDENRERARAAKRQSARNVEQARALEFRFGAGMLIGLLWFAALLAPSMLKDMSSSENGTGLFLLGIWAIAVVDAVRKWRRGLRRQLYLVVLIPGVLLVLGIAIRWGT
jgi:hypothetical protein